MSQMQIQAAIIRAYKFDPYLLAIFIKVLCPKVGSQSSKVHLVDVSSRLVGREILQQQIHGGQCCNTTSALSLDKPPHAHLLYIPNEGSELATA